MRFLAKFFFRYLFLEEAWRAPSQGELFIGKQGGPEFVISGGYGGAGWTVPVVSAFSWRIWKTADGARRTFPSDVSGSSSPRFETCWNTGGFFFFFFLRCKMKEKKTKYQQKSEQKFSEQFLEYSSWDQWCFIFQIVEVLFKKLFPKGLLHLHIKRLRSFSFPFCLSLKLTHRC